MFRIKSLKLFLISAVAFLLSGCNAVLLKPSGDIAVQQRDLIYIATGLMLIVIVPVIIATIVFAWRYRASNASARYEPDWDHSTKLELVIWSVPLMIIIALGSITWVSTHLLDPYRPLDRIEAGRPVPADVKPLTVEVVAMDWKWLFIYPEYGFATVNELAAPVDRPITFKITASSVMNSFFIPALAGQIYAMAGMQTMLHAVINKSGVYEGMSANYSGAGFSGMNFKFHGLSEADFEKWVAKNRSAGGELDRASYLKLEQPSQNDPVRRYASVAPDLYEAILNRCVRSGTICMRDMMHMDMKGGGGMEGVHHPGTPDMPMPHRHPPKLDASEISAADYVGDLCSYSEAEALARARAHGVSPDASLS
ncbi:ubiquinol oxidase subunit II [Allopusillimonas soli]|uniref:Ubiquinol oxidase subunit 2 n=1 Tax=Allopusillimonas soli TaxID=659016 RepID=A0A853FBP0_9BURK|nr:ubiquinol oxidase subunit II [Allopusillimonas soli]NYT35961.1 ubiquinol oxidase subunit II [Allopusillimonas soli]TEA76308.1 ubiquinol oxidase subunit II [Allopusillimonas soli]